MAKDQRIATLPDTDHFWKSVDNDQTREFYAACIFERIRNASPSNDTLRIELIAQLQCMVQLMDSPKEIFRSITISKIEEAENKELEDAL